MRRRALVGGIAVAIALVAAGLTWRWRSERAAVERDPRGALVRATRALERAPGDAGAAWERARALAALGLGHTAADAFESVATQDGAHAAAARERARGLRDELRAREHGARPPAATLQTIDAAVAAAAATLHGGGDAHGGDAHGGDARGGDARGGEEHHGDARGGDARAAERQALAAYAAARAAGCDPHDQPRRALVVAIDAARAENEPALAAAYLGEARALLTAW